MASPMSLDARAREVGIAEGRIDESGLLRDNSEFAASRCAQYRNDKMAVGYRERRIPRCVRNPKEQVESRRNDNQANSSSIFFSAGFKETMRKLRTCPATTSRALTGAEPVFHLALSMAVREDRSAFGDAASS